MPAVAISMLRAAAPVRARRSCLKGARGTSSSRKVAGRGLRFIELPAVREIPCLHVEVDYEKTHGRKGYVLKCVDVSGITHKDFGHRKADDSLRRPDLDLVKKHAVWALVLARQRGIALANGTLAFYPRPPSDDPDEPWAGTPRVHQNDDRRTPLVWIRGGVAQKMVDPSETYWYKLAKKQGEA